MKYNLYVHNIELTALDQEYLDKKLDRITKFLKTPYTTDVTFDRNMHHKQGQVVTCKINITQGKQLIRAERTEDNAQDALDRTLEAIKQSLNKRRTKERANKWSIKNLFSGNN